MVGDGFRVSQYIPGYNREMNNDTSPFLMLDYNPPWKIEPQKNGHRPGVGFHPHRGFETVTIVYSGEVEHRDTAGHGGIIGPDEVQWMTAGSGLLHEEKMTPEFSRMGWVQHAVQLWVNLPREHKMTTPRYQALTKQNIREVSFEGGRARVIAGELQMKASVIPGLSRDPGNNNESFFAGSPHTRGWQELQTTDNDEIIKQKWAAKTFSPVELYDIRFDTASEISLHIPDGFTTMILVVEWSISLGDRKLENSDMVHLSRDWEDVTLASLSNAKILVMGGKPLDEPIASYGPFVMNTHEELMQAFADVNSGRMGIIPWL